MILLYIFVVQWYYTHIHYIVVYGVKPINPIINHFQYHSKWVVKIIPNGRFMGFTTPQSPHPNISLGFAWGTPRKIKCSLKFTIGFKGLPKSLYSGALASCQIIGFTIRSSNISMENPWKPPINGKFGILNWRYVNVPFLWPYFLGIFSKTSAKNIGLKKMHIGTSNKLVPGQHGHWLNYH